MKYRLLRFSLLSVLVMLCGGLSLAAILETTGNENPAGFRDIKIDLTQHSELLTESNVYITVAEDGTIGTTDNEENAAATIKGKAHGSYGSSNFTASVPVKGCVKITYATHDYGNDIVVTNTEGKEVAKFNTNGAKWMSNHDNVVVAYYRTNEPTTLNFSKANYNPYFAVEAIAEADLPAEVTNYNITFAAGEGATGVAPAALEIQAGSKFTAPKNYTLYKEGATLTGWNDGTKTYAVGEEITPTADMTLTAVYTTNEVSLADRPEAVVIDFALDGYNDNPKYKFQGNTGIIVSQATVKGKAIDVKADVDATSGKFAHNGSGWHQVNTGTKVTVPSAKDAIIKVSTYNDETGASMTFAGNNGTADNKVVGYTATAEDATCEIAQVANNYWNKLTVTLPASKVAEQDITGTWDYSNAAVMEATMALSGSNEAGEVSSIEGTLKMTVLANGASFRNNGNNIQVRNGAEFRIPVRTAGDLVTIKGYPGYSYYKINDGDEITNTNDNPQTEYKAKGSDAERGYVSVVSTNGNNYFLSLSVVQYAPKEKITLDNEPATATFPFNEGTEGQKATFSNADYFLSSKVNVGSNWSIQDKSTYAGTTETRLTPADQHDDNLTDADAVSFVITPKPGFTFTPTKVAFKANRYGTDNGLIDAYWQNANGTTVELEKGIKPERNNSNKNTEKSYDITGATAGEGTCGLKLFLYHLQAGKQIGLADIVIEGVLNGTEKDVPVLASFKINGNEYAVEDVFGEQYEATLELSKAETMVSANNPLTDVTAKSGEVGTITYAEKENACTVTIPMTAGETLMDYVLNVVYKPDFTLSYLDVEGNVLKTQLVEKDAAIGEFAYDINDVAATKDGYKARGWFKTGVLGEKYTTADVITADTKLYSIQTEIEVPSTHKKYNFDLTDKLFYAEDHEAFNPAGEGYYWHDAQHGWAFKNGNTVDLLVGPKATITITLCQYGSGTGIVVKKGDQTLATLDGKAEGDGGTAVYSYEGEPGTLTLEMQCSGEMYIHAVKIVNTAEVNFDSDGNWYFVKAGDGSSLIDVIDVVNGKNAAKDAERSFIFLPKGTYDLDATVKTAITGHNISIIGESMDKTIIVTKPDKSVEGLGKADLLDVSGTNLYMQDLTLKNALDYYNAGSAGRAAVLQDAGNRTIGKNVRMLSYQDTYYSSNSSQQAYWETCDIHGTVDFICGGGDIRFQNTTISLEPRKTDGSGSRTIVAPTTNTQFGYVFDGCTVVDLAQGKGDWNFGRTWQNNPITVYLNTTLDDNAKNTLISTRWIEKGMNNKDPKVFGEFGTKDAAGADITPASNKINSHGGVFETILTAEQAAEYAYEKMFAGDWKPMAIAAQLEAPEASYADGVISGLESGHVYLLTNSANGSWWIINETTGTFALADAPQFKFNAGDELTIRAANARGGFGPAKQVAGTATSIQAINAAMERGEQVIFNLAGQRVNKATKGLYIINGKKVVVK